MKIIYGDVAKITEVDGVMTMKFTDTLKQSQHIFTLEVRPWPSFLATFVVQEREILLQVPTIYRRHTPITKADWQGRPRNGLQILKTSRL
jgi:hypothetical protein